MLCTDFSCHPGTGSTGSRPNPASLNSAARAQQPCARCCRLAKGRPEDIPSAKANSSLCSGRTPYAEQHTGEEQSTLRQPINPQKPAIATRRRLQLAIHRRRAPRPHKGLLGTCLPARPVSEPVAGYAAALTPAAHTHSAIHSPPRHSQLVSGILRAQLGLSLLPN